MVDKVKRLIVTSIILVTLIRSVQQVAGASFQCEAGCTCTGVEINCANADLDAIPTFATIQGANIVDLSNNHIEEIDEVFPWQGIEQLQFLYLNTNSIYYIRDATFVTLINLEYVDLSNNYIEVLPDRLFERNVRMTTLSLQGNSFQYQTPKIVSQSLEHLDMSFCKLSTFTQRHVRHMPNLKYLNLQVNNLMYMQPEIFAEHAGISLVLSYNYWACNCSTVALYKWAIDNAPRIVIDEKCNNKNNIHINMFTDSRDFLYKERCDIDEDSFGMTPMKNLSLTKAPTNTTNSSIHLSDAADDHRQHDKEMFNDAWIVFVVMALVIVLVAIAVGVVVGVFVGRFLHRNDDSRRYRKSISAAEPTFV